MSRFVFYYPSRRANFSVIVPDPYDSENFSLKSWVRNAVLALSLFIHTPAQAASLKAGDISMLPKNVQQMIMRLPKKEMARVIQEVCGARRWHGDVKPKLEAASQYENHISPENIVADPYWSALRETILHPDCIDDADKAAKSGVKIGPRGADAISAADKFIDEAATYTSPLFVDPDDIDEEDPDDSEYVNTNHELSSLYHKLFPGLHKSLDISDVCGSEASGCAVGPRIATDKRFPGKFLTFDSPGDMYVEWQNNPNTETNAMTHEGAHSLSYTHDGLKDQGVGSKLFIDQGKEDVKFGERLATTVSREMLNRYANKATDSENYRWKRSETVYNTQDDFNTIKKLKYSIHDPHILKQLSDIYEKTDARSKDIVDLITTFATNYNPSLTKDPQAPVSRNRRNVQALKKHLTRMRKKSGLKDELVSNKAKAVKMKKLPEYIASQLKHLVDMGYSPEELKYSMQELYLTDVASPKHIDKWNRQVSAMARDMYRKGIPAMEMLIRTPGEKQSGISEYENSIQNYITGSSFTNEDPMNSKYQPDMETVKKWMSDYYSTLDATENKLKKKHFSRGVFLA